MDSGQPRGTRSMRKVHWLDRSLVAALLALAAALGGVGWLGAGSAAIYVEAVPPATASTAANEAAASLVIMTQMLNEESFTQPST